LLVWNSSLASSISGFDAFELLPLFLLPKIRRLYFNLGLFSDYIKTAPEWFSRHNGKSSVKEITFGRWFIGTPSMSAILKLPFTLEKFTYIHLAATHQYLMPSTSALAEALSNQAHSLKSFDYRLRPNMRMFSLDPFPVKTWKNFHALEELRVPLNLLHIENGRVRPYLEDELLPNMTDLRLYHFADDIHWWWRCRLHDVFL
jgi:hypothetical protein